MTRLDVLPLLIVHHLELAAQLYAESDDSRGDLNRAISRAIMEPSKIKTFIDNLLGPDRYDLPR